MGASLATLCDASWRLLPHPQDGRDQFMQDPQSSFHTALICDLGTDCWARLYREKCEDYRGRIEMEPLWGPKKEGSNTGQYKIVKGKAPKGQASCEPSGDWTSINGAGGRLGPSRIWATELQGPILSLLTCAYQGDEHTDASPNASLNLIFFADTHKRQVIAL